MRTWLWENMPELSAAMGVVTAVLAHLRHPYTVVAGLLTLLFLITPAVLFGYHTWYEYRERRRRKETAQELTARV